jgi:hypothetical protein
MQSKSPTLTQSPTLYGDAINASLQVSFSQWQILEQSIALGWICDHYYITYTFKLTRGFLLQAALADSSLPYMGSMHVGSVSPDQAPMSPMDSR